jgi:hypothetical protein
MLLIAGKSSDSKNIVYHFIFPDIETSGSLTNTTLHTQNKTPYSCMLYITATCMDKPNFCYPKFPVYAKENVITNRNHGITG